MSFYILLSPQFKSHFHYFRLFWFFHDCLVLRVYINNTVLLFCHNSTLYSGSIKSQNILSKYDSIQPWKFRKHHWCRGMHDLCGWWIHSFRALNSVGRAIRGRCDNYRNYVVGNPMMDACRFIRFSFRHCLQGNLNKEHEIFKFLSFLKMTASKGKILQRINIS